MRSLTTEEVHLVAGGSSVFDISGLDPDWVRMRDPLHPEYTSPDCISDPFQLKLWDDLVKWVKGVVTPKATNQDIQKVIETCQKMGATSISYASSGGGSQSGQLGPGSVGAVQNGNVTLTCTRK